MEPRDVEGVFVGGPFNGRTVVIRESYTSGYYVVPDGHDGMKQFWYRRKPGTNEYHPSTKPKETT